MLTDQLFFDQFLGKIRIQGLEIEHGRADFRECRRRQFGCADLLALSQKAH
jgi:hypothetical protein